MPIDALCSDGNLSKKHGTASAMRGISMSASPAAFIGSRAAPACLPLVAMYSDGMRAQPLIVVRDVEASSRFYRRLLGCALGGDGRGHHGSGPPEYERLYDPRLHHSTWGPDGLILQLHVWEADHHHGHLGDPNQPVGNGMMLWFEVDDFDEAVSRARELKAPVILDVHFNPNAQHRELWLRDPDGYTVVLASPDGEEAPSA